MPAKELRLSYKNEKQYGGTDNDNDPREISVLFHVAGREARPWCDAAHRERTESSRAESASDWLHRRFAGR